MWRSPSVGAGGGSCGEAAVDELYRRLQRDDAGKAGTKRWRAPVMIVDRDRDERVANCRAAAHLGSLRMEDMVVENAVGERVEVFGDCLDATRFDYVTRPL